MNIVIISYRISGNDGVSIECVHWRNILERMGHKVTFVAGELDQEGILLPELHFKLPQVAGIHRRVVYSNESYQKVERVIFDIAGMLEGRLRQLFRNGVRPDLLIVPNVFSIPMHFPLAVALARTVKEFSIKTLARHHDFWWERERYNKSEMFQFFDHWFPPKEENIWHTVINSLAQKELEKRTGIIAPIIPDTFDFENNELNRMDEYSKHFRQDFGIEESDFVFLQATRIVPRKRIELSIELLSKLNQSNSILVINGTEGDEEKGYLKKLKKMSEVLGVRAKFIGGRVDSRRKIIAGKRVYTLWDCYLNSDFVTYPTEVEGFGNQFVESMYFKLPLIITPYEVYRADIAPLGFDVIEMQNEVTDDVLERVRELSTDSERKINMVNHNFEVARKNLSYNVVETKIINIFKKTERW